MSEIWSQTRSPTIPRNFWATVCKTVPLCYPTVVCLSVLSVCDVGLLWPNGWMDQDETWRAGRPRPGPHCVRRGPSSPSPNGHSFQFSAHICCGQMAGRIKMQLGRGISIRPSDIVLDGDPAPLKGAQPLPIFGSCLLWPNGWMDQDATWYAGRPQPRVVSERELTFTFAICYRPSVCHLSVCRLSVCRLSVVCRM